MRVAVYNQMFGFDGRSFFGNVFAHYLVHYQSDFKKVLRASKLGPTLKEIKKVNADVVGICEIFEGQEKILIKRLKKLGYRYFHLGRGHRFKYMKQHVLELVASKIYCKKLNFKEWPVENHLGGGGGLVACYFPKLGLSLVHAHLGQPSKRFFEQQMKHIQKIIKQFKGRVILMGDFNENYEKIKHHFSNLELVTGKDKTCSYTPIMRWFYLKDTDHVLVRGFKKKDFGTLLGHSDHKLLFVDLE